MTYPQSRHFGDRLTLTQIVRYLLTRSDNGCDYKTATSIYLYLSENEINDLASGDRKRVASMLAAYFSQPRLDITGRMIRDFQWDRSLRGETYSLGHGCDDITILDDLRFIKTALQKADDEHQWLVEQFEQEQY